MTKETWAELAQRVNPANGQIFKDDRGEWWIYYNAHFKHEKSAYFLRTDGFGEVLSCTLVDAIENVEKPKMRKMTYENKWAVYYRVGNRAHVLFSDFLPRSFLNEFTEVEGTIRAEGDGTQYVHWSVEIAQWENKPVVEMMHAFLAVEDATPLDFMCDTNEKRI